MKNEQLTKAADEIYEIIMQHQFHVGGQEAFDAKLLPVLERLVGEAAMDGWHKKEEKPETLKEVIALVRWENGILEIIRTAWLPGGRWRARGCDVLGWRYRPDDPTVAEACAALAIDFTTEPGGA